MDNSLQLIYAGRSESNIHISATNSRRGGSSSSSSTARRMSGDTEQRAKALADRLSEVAKILANEPSLALYRIEEHVRKTVPRLAAQRAEVARLDRDIAGHVTDVDCVLSTLHSIGRSRDTFRSIGESAKNALFLKQQLEYEKRRRAATAGVSSVNTEAGKQRSSSSVFDDLAAATTQTLASSSSSAAASGNASSSVLETARTFLRAKTLDYSQNIIRRAQATKSVEIVNPPPPLPPPPPTLPPPPSTLPPPPPPPLPPRPPLRSTSVGSAAQLLSTLKPVAEFEDEELQQQQPALQPESSESELEGSRLDDASNQDYSSSKPTEVKRQEQLVVEQPQSQPESQLPTASS